MPFDENELNTLISTSARGSTQAPDMGHYLVAVDGDEPGRYIEVGADGLTIGRDQKQALVFNDSELSRLHARVSLDQGTVLVEDKGSTNGTFVDGVRVASAIRLKEGNVLRVGKQFLKYERHRREDVARSRELNRDLEKARQYVWSLLPAPLDAGPVRTAWRYLPSTQLGGDAFGYYWLDPDTFVFYLVDVSGHGVGSAMHSVSVLNVLRQRALPQVAFTDPAQVLESLNSRFQMQEHGNLYFTMWYGVYRLGLRTVTYSAAGHHPAYLVGADRVGTNALSAPAPPIGMLPNGVYEVSEVTVPEGSVLYIFSDGVCEFVKPDDRESTLEEFVPLLLEPLIPGVPEPERLYRAVKERAKPDGLIDDFSLLALTFL